MTQLKLQHLVIVIVLAVSAGTSASGQTASEDMQFGPVVRSYLGYLRNEQNVVDDRVSRHEVSRDYYRRNSNRIRALRLMAIRIADENGNDYLPELEAVAGDEFRLLFEHPPRTQTLRVGSLVGTTFRYLGSVRSTELFYVFARLDPYEQAELMQTTHSESETAGNSGPATPAATRARRVSNPK
ncbi:MAG TPA: hypothetical protein VJU86_21800 [Pyrinomonadaceae bacterium]|nr:hypothetical protein [Pyrinomonadaceae bacterium]